MGERFCIYGFHAVTGRLRQDPGSVLQIYLDEARRDRRARDLTSLAQTRGVRVILVPKARLDGMTGQARHQGVAAQVEPIRLPVSLEEVLAGLREPALLLVLDGIQDPRNLGACLRVADALGAHAVIAPKDRAVGLTPTVSKVASGAAEAVPYLIVTNLIRALREMKEAGIQIVGASADANADLFSCRLDGPLAWVLGAEGSGMRRLTRENCDALARIPMAGTVESLNVAVAAGICLYESQRQRVAGEAGAKR